MLRLGVRFRSSFVLRSRACLSTKTEAVQPSKEAIQVGPFDPSVWEDLKVPYQALDTSPFEPLAHNVSSEQLLLLGHKMLSLPLSSRRMALIAWKMADERGNDHAKYVLSGLLRSGLGMEKDAVKADEMLHELVDRKFSPALDTLAHMYRKGVGVAKHYSRALSLFKEAAERGFINSHFMIAHMYFNGEGTQKSIKEGLTWLRKGAEVNDKRCLLTLGCWHAEKNRPVGYDMAKAVEYMTRSAAVGSHIAQFNMGVWHMLGQHVPQDYALAGGYFARSAVQHFPQAEVNLAILHRLGLGVPKDLDLAIALLQKHKLVNIANFHLNAAQNEKSGTLSQEDLSKPPSPEPFFSQTEAIHIKSI
eukprot:GILK01009243.1.p1 GENE.GILK01009243.1~~GILK01009243.1.p1  ORF type:complete len:361 (-),score=44.08 GILK01009243.1:268-1350(-)